MTRGLRGLIAAAGSFCLPREAVHSVSVASLVIAAAGLLTF